MPHVLPADLPTAPTAPPAPPALSALDRELKSLRRLLETQLATLGWNDLSRRSPVAAELLRQLAELGLDRDVAASVIDTVPPDTDLGLAREIALDALRTRIDVTGDRWVDQGGVLVMMGPAGSGKTSALAAIAARWVMRHGPAGAALVSAGDTRFGAYEQLSRMGRLLGVPTYRVDDAKELPRLLDRLRGQRLVLVDTASTAAVRDIATVVLTLPATSQAATLHQAASRYRRLGATACVVTRLDEATSLGGLLSALIVAQLPLAYVIEGTRFPDDLRPARAAEMVQLAMTLAERHGATADEELLVRRMGGRMHASA
jgi:flagellar biosynthesis protein FlhF